VRETAIVFARAPQLGAVKRRLAHDIGDRAALRFYQANLFRLLRSLHRDRRFRTVLATTPDRAAARWPVRIPIIPQGRGDIGQRMHRACARFRSVAIIGSDIPDACADDMALAFRASRHAGAAFGPSMDGGYWLVALGSRRPARPFASVRWSSEHALADTLRNFRRRPAMLRTLQDVDTAADLAAIRSRSNAPAGAA
jgi:rSAM/selenodomain-associated transferase 1